ncbi:hypothetical protein ABKN59_009034 [Abortiporus biennis]
MPTLPQELIDTIVNHLSNDRKTLQSLSVTAPIFQYSSRRILFRSIKINCRFSKQKLERFSNLLISSSSSVGTYIQELELNDGEMSRRKPAKSLSIILPNFLECLPNLQSLSIIGFGWSSSTTEEEYTVLSKSNSPISLRKLSLNHFTIENSDLRSQVYQLLDFCSIFGTIDEFTVKQIWTPNTRLISSSYELIKGCINEALGRRPDLLERFQVSSLDLDADHDIWTNLFDPQTDHVSTIRVDPDYINSTTILDFVRNTTSSLRSLSIHPSTLAEVSAAKALIAHSAKSLIWLKLSIIDGYDAELDDDVQLADYIFDLTECKSMKTLQFEVGASSPSTYYGMRETLRILSKQPTTSLRTIALQITISIDIWDNVSNDDIFEYVFTMGWEQIDTILTSENFATLEKVIVDVSNMPLYWDRTAEQEEPVFLKMFEDSMREKLKLNLMIDIRSE